MKTIMRGADRNRGVGRYRERQVEKESNRVSGNSERKREELRERERRVRDRESVCQREKR